MDKFGPNVIAHLDNSLGIQEGQAIWSFEKSGFWIFKYDDQPQKDACSYITAGLGRHLLEQESGIQIRQELMMTFWKEAADTHPEKKLASLALDFLDRHIPIPNHQVIPWQGGVFEGHAFSALYCTGARHMSEEFEVIDSEPNLIFVWLIPIYPEEQEYIKVNGWKTFEDLIDDQQPDFFDLEKARVQFEV